MKGGDASVTVVVESKSDLRLRWNRSLVCRDRVSSCLEFSKNGTGLNRILLARQFWFGLDSARFSTRLDSLRMVPGSSDRAD